MRILAESKISSIFEIVFKALRDNRTNDREFKLVLDEVEAYKELKEKLQAEAHETASSETIDEEAKQELIKQFDKG